VADFAGEGTDAGSRPTQVRVAHGEDVPVITAKVIHRDVDRASREAARLGGVFDPSQQVWLFRASSTFELSGGVMQLRFAGLLPLEMRYGNQVEAIWIDYDFGRRVMQWRPVGDRTRLTLRKVASQIPQTE
jgi:hypothetical protein